MIEYLNENNNIIFLLFVSLVRSCSLNHSSPSSCFFRLDQNHETVNSVPNQSPIFGNNQYHTAFEYWNGPSSIAIMPIKSPVDDENVDGGFENIQRYL